MPQKLKILYRSDPRTRTCPDCGEFGTLKRSRGRNWIESLIKVISPLKIYRCKSCGWRGYRTAYVFKIDSIKAVFFYFVLIALTFMIVSFVLKRFVN